jgi:hypothetical protein
LARSPNVVFDQPLAAACTTADVTSNSMSPVGHDDE